jgi:hypothetical protein
VTTGDFRALFVQAHKRLQGFNRSDEKTGGRVTGRPRGEQGRTDHLGLLAYGCGGGGAGGLSQLPGVPAGTCIPSQLHGIIDRHAMNAHC